ncbi:MAG: hypothetical protein CMJ83_15190 [Planctomycetes bacterium]|nr:hypothetical protein [Planctomycetota bacterium]
MFISRSLMTVAFVVLGSAVSTAAGQLVVTVSTAEPVAGGTQSVNVESGPETPATVELWIDGKLEDTVVLNGVPGVATLNIPETASGKDWEVIVESGDEVFTKNGKVQ